MFYCLIFCSIVCGWFVCSNLSIFISTICLLFEISSNIFFFYSHTMFLIHFVSLYSQYTYNNSKDLLHLLHFLCLSIWVYQYLYVLCSIVSLLVFASMTLICSLFVFSFIFFPYISLSPFVFSCVLQLFLFIVCIVLVDQQQLFVYLLICYCWNFFFKLIVVV